MLKLPRDRECNGVPIYYFRTYVGAAVKAYNANMITSDAVGRIISAAKIDMTKLTPSSSSSNPLLLKFKRKPNLIQSYLIQSRRKELDLDIREAQNIVKIKIKS
jgi:hypothetical protein